jgi:protein-S-isoprenylcysteine O-methyltransferase Ste14
MENETNNQSENASEDSTKPLAKALLPRILASSVGFAIFLLAWFGIAGRVNWIQGWAFLFVFIVYVSILVWKLARLDPDLVRERNRPSDSAEPWDRVIMGMYTCVLMILLLLAALDSGRFGWSKMPLLVQLIGWALLILAGMIIWHVMVTNTYLSSWARIQEDRGQVVIKEGLYGHIRHPMYLGIILAFLGIPFALGSWWAMIPSVMIVCLFIYRTIREDRMLMEGLAGYAEYKEEVRYRLLPGIW